MEQAELPICMECDPPRTFGSQRALASHQKVHAGAIICPECEDEVRYLGPHLTRVHHLTGDDLDPLVRLAGSFATELRLLRLENAELKRRLDPTS
jgi:hypothetical protein